MAISPEDQERILTRSTEMLSLAREVIKKLHQEGRDADEPTYKEEPSIPEMVAVAHLLTNMSAGGLFREKLPEKTGPPPSFLPPPPLASPETLRIIVESVLRQLDRVIEAKLFAWFPPGFKASALIPLTQKEKLRILELAVKGTPNTQIAIKLNVDARQVTGFILSAIKSGKLPKDAAPEEEI